MELFILFKKKYMSVDFNNSAESTWLLSYKKIKKNDWFDQYSERLSVDNYPLKAILWDDAYFDTVMPNLFFQEFKNQQRQGLIPHRTWLTWIELYLKINGQN
jgi:hypothetical protein